MTTDFIHIPIGALIKRPVEEEDRYLNQLSQLPPNLRAVVTSTRTGAFLEGLLKTHDILSPENSLVLSLIIIQICFGEKTLAQLPSIISTELKLANDKSQKIASEIERDLFAPIMLEYNQFMASKKQQTGSSVASAQSSGAQNVLDLKTQPKQTLPPPMPPNRFPATRE